MTEEQKIYCLQRHFAAFYRQSKCEEHADFTEPCEECKIFDSCKAKWTDVLPFSEDIILLLGCRALGKNKGIGGACPSECTYYDRHIQSLSSCNDAQATE